MLLFIVKMSQKLTVPDIAIWNLHANGIMKKAGPKLICKGGVEDLFLERGEQIDSKLIRLMLTWSADHRFAGGMVFSRDAYKGSFNEYWMDVWPTKPSYVEDGIEGIWENLFGASDPRIRDCYDVGDNFSYHYIRLFQSNELEMERDDPGYIALVLPEPDYRHPVI